MRELNDFNSWAENIISEAISEKAEPQANDTIKRSVPIAKDVMFQAQRKYRDYEPEQALSLFLADKLEDFDRRDLDQNKVINAQRQENDKLKREVGTLGQELENLQAHSQESDSELERLRQLSGGLRADVEQRRVGSREVQDLLAQVEALKNKSGMDPESYEKLKAQIEKEINDFREKGVNPEKFAELQQQLDNITRAARISGDDLENIEKLLQQVEAGQQKVEVEKTNIASRIKDLEQSQAELEQREKNIDKEIDKKVAQAAARAGRRGTQAEYKRSKARLDYLEDEVIPKLIQTNTEQSANIETIRTHDQYQDKEIENLGGKAPARLIKLAAPVEKDGLEDFTTALMGRLRQGQLPLPANTKPKSSEPEQNADAETQQSQVQNPEQEPDNKQGLNVVPSKTNESKLLEVQMTPEEFEEQKRIAYQYAIKWAPLYYQIWEREPDKRRAVRRYAHDDVVDAIFQSVFHWLIKVGRYAVEDEERLWRTALEILVAQHPYVEYDDLGIDPSKIRGSALSRSDYARKVNTTVNPEPVQGTLPLDNKPDGVKESRLPRKLSHQIDSLAENILGEQYSKYLR
jgi:hypothetical protein